MLRCSTRAIFINRNEVTRFGSLNISRHPFCSQVADNGGDGSPSKSEKDAALNILSKAPNTSKVVQAIHVVAQMADLKRSKKISEQDYKSDSRYQNMIKLLESNTVNNADPLSLVKGLKVRIIKKKIIYIYTNNSPLQALTELGVPNDSYSVLNIENSLMWSTRSCPIKDLMFLLSFTMSRRQTDSQTKLFTEVCKTLERRWVEIKGEEQFQLVSDLPDNMRFLNRRQPPYSDDAIRQFLGPFE